MRSQVRQMPVQVGMWHKPAAAKNKTSTRRTTPAFPSLLSDALLGSQHGLCPSSPQQTEQVRKSYLAHHSGHR